MVAHHPLNLADGLGHRLQPLFQHAGQDLHQHQAAEMGGSLLGKFGQLREGGDLMPAVQPLSAIVEQQQHAPRLRKR